MDYGTTVIDIVDHAFSTPGPLKQKTIGGNIMHQSFDTSLKTGGVSLSSKKQKQGPPSSAHSYHHSNMTTSSSFQ